LIRGDLINKMGELRPHTNSLTLTLGWLIDVFGGRRINAKTPIDVAPEDNPTSEPQPDLIVLKRDTSEFPQDNPGPRDLALVVEVSDATLYFDLMTKVALYARAGIADCWVLDVVGRRMIIHRQPHNGRYVSVVAYSADEVVSPLAAPNASLRVSDVFIG
jgi:Uma2 family endonuclease